MVAIFRIWSHGRLEATFVAVGMIAQEPEQIGLLKAIGYGRWTIAPRYVMLVLVIAAPGRDALVESASGVPLAARMEWNAL